MIDDGSQIFVSKIILYSSIFFLARYRNIYASTISNCTLSGDFGEPAPLRFLPLVFHIYKNARRTSVFGGFGFCWLTNYCDSKYMRSSHVCCRWTTHSQLPLFIPRKITEILYEVKDPYGVIVAMLFFHIYIIIMTSRRFFERTEHKLLYSNPQRSNLFITPRTRDAMSLSKTHHPHTAGRTHRRN
jgi:hypothetical protein